GEYGLFPGARVANLWRWRDGGRGCELVERVSDARHVHCVFELPGGDELLVTTRHVPPERAARRGPPRNGPARAWPKARAGFTAAAATRAYVPLGTDLDDDNALLRWRRGARALPDAVRLPRELDLPVRTLAALGERGVIALLACDDGCE